jgi:hemolysin activation/secretion protein
MLLAAMLMALPASGANNPPLPDTPPVDAGALQQQIQKEAPNLFMAPLPEVGVPKSEQVEGESAVQILIKGVRLQGVHLVNEQALMDALAPSLGKTYSMQGLQKLVDAVSDFYAAQGFVVQVFLPEQNMKEDGVLLIQVVEANLGGVSVENKDGLARLSNEQATAYVLSENALGKALNTTNLAKSMAVLNELSGVKASSALEAGDKDGETKVHLALSRTSLVDARVEAKNTGSRSTGEAQGVISAAWNSPLKQGDQASFYGMYSAGSNFSQVMYSVPVGYRGLRLALTGNYLDYQNVGSYKTNGGFGNAWVMAANLSYPMQRSQNTNANVMLGFEKKGYLNRDLASREVNSSFDIENINIGANANHYDALLGGGMSSVNASLVLGHLDLDASTPATFGAYCPTTNDCYSYVPNHFTKLTFNASRMQFLPWPTLQLNMNVSGQLSANNLNSSEQFYLGGPNGVRAYPVAQAGGSQGMLASIELQKTLPQHLVASVFFDAGTVQQYKDPYPGWQGDTAAANGYELYGAGMSVKWTSGKWNAAAVLAWKVGNNPLKIVKDGAYVYLDNDGTDSNPRAWLNASYTF